MLRLGEFLGESTPVPRRGMTNLVVWETASARQEGRIDIDLSDKFDAWRIDDPVP